MVPTVGTTLGIAMYTVDVSTKIQKLDFKFMNQYESVFST